MSSRVVRSDPLPHKTFQIEPVETYRRSADQGAFFVSTGALQGLEPARAPTSRRKSATSGTRQPEAAPQRPMACTAEANAVESPLRHHRNS